QDVLLALSRLRHANLLDLGSEPKSCIALRHYTLSQERSTFSAPLFRCPGEDRFQHRPVSFYATSQFLDFFLVSQGRPVLEGLDLEQRRLAKRFQRRVLVTGGIGGSLE